MKEHTFKYLLGYNEVLGQGKGIRNTPVTNMDGPSAPHETLF